MFASAAARHGAHVRREVYLDVCGERLDVSRGEVEMLRDAAALRAGNSSRARDLSLLLERALASGQVLVLRRGEGQTLRNLALQLGIDRLAAKLAVIALAG